MVDEVGPSGEIKNPPVVRAKFRNALGAVIRTKVPLDPTIQDWKKVPQGKKLEMWELIGKSFKFPKNTDMEKVYKRTVLTLGECFRRWKCELNKLVQDGKPKPEGYKITDAQWAEFVRQKTTADAIATSEKQRRLAQRNIHPARLGPGGYAGKAEMWAKQREDAIAAGLPDPFAGVNDRAFQWIKGREDEEDAPDGTKTRAFKRPETEAVVEKIFDLAERQRNGEFVPNRDKDMLAESIGTKEHGGRIRGISKHLSFKDGFSNDRERYRRHDRYKDEIKEAAEKALQARFSDYFAAALAEQQQRQMITQPSVTNNLMVMQPPQLLTGATASTICPSSVASTSAEPYAVDDITVDTPCSLHIPIGRSGKTKEAAKGVALVVSSNPELIGHHIPPLYAWVRVLTIMDARHDDHFLDISLDEGIETLGQAVGKNAPWHKRDIILESPPPPQGPTSLTPCSQSQRIMTPAQVHGGNNTQEDLQQLQAGPPSEPQPIVATTISNPSTPQIVHQESQHPSQLHLEENTSPPAVQMDPCPPTPQVQLSDEPATVLKLQPRPGQFRGSVPRVIQAYKNTEPDVVNRWMTANKCSNKKTIQTKKKHGKDVVVPTGPGFSKPRTDHEFFRKVGVDDIGDLPDSPMKFEYGKDLLPDWALHECPGEMQKFHSWYRRACTLGLKSIWAYVDVDVFGCNTWEKQSTDIVMDFDDIHAMFRLQMMELSPMRLWCM